MIYKRILLSVMMTCHAAMFSFAQSTEHWEVDTEHVVSSIQPTMYGIFFEDINFAADGGIYAEMIKNRSFEFEDPLMGWVQPNSDRHSLNEGAGMAAVIRRNMAANNHYLNVKVNNSEGYRLINEGFRGMGVEQGKIYKLSFQAKVNSGIKSVKFSLIQGGSEVLSACKIDLIKGEWQSYSCELSPIKTSDAAQMLITFEGTGTVDLDMISLFPKDTWKGRPNGLRKDLVQLLFDLKPGFLRFPGGCIVEGRTLAKRYQWKKTVGPVEDRPVLVNRWNTEFAHKRTPDYFQSFGLGFYEYFLLAEDLGAQPLPILSCGMACQFNTAELVPLNELDPYVQDALDLVEFANGNIESAWGKVRAEMGHPEPFNLKFIGVGNEQWGPEYFERLEIFIKAIKAKYPEMVIVSGTGPFPDGEQFDFAENKLKELRAEIVDEHYYRTPDWFFENARRYDNYDRNNYKIFAGEYAAQSDAIASAENQNNWNTALAEAAYLTGLERNADVVYMTSYAPLFAHINAWQWSPDLIWFDNLKAYGTPNYYVQKLFSNNKGEELIYITSDGNAIKGQKDLYASAVLNNNRKQVIVKAVNASGERREINITLKGHRFTGKAEVELLTADNLEEVNSIIEPAKVSPTTEEVSFIKGELHLTLKPYSFYVISGKVK